MEQMNRKQNNYLGMLPDEIYKLIMAYIFLPKIALNRMESRYRWNTNLFINKCCMCNLSAKHVGLAYSCGCHDEEPSYCELCKDGCKNQLICFDCAHS